MPDFKGSLASPCGSFSTPITFSGPDVRSALARLWSEIFRAKVISITEPLGPGDFFICHDGRQIKYFNCKRSLAEVVYADRVHSVSVAPAR